MRVSCTLNSTLPQALLYYQGCSGKFFLGGRSYAYAALGFIFLEGFTFHSVSTPLPLTFVLFYNVEYTLEYGVNLIPI